MVRPKAKETSPERTAAETVAEAIGDHWEDLRELPWGKARRVILYAIVGHIRDSLDTARTEGYLDGHGVGFELGFSDGVVHCDRKHED